MTDQEFTQDYIFVSEAGHVLDIDAMEPDRATEHAQTLARQHRTEVTYAIVVDYKVTPDTCGNCGEILPTDGACPCDDFGDLAGEPVAPTPRPMVPLVIFPLYGENHTLTVPQGECAYWGSVVNRCLGNAVMGADWADEVANLPYLGQVAMASDKANLQFLQQQISLIQTIEEAGLNVGDILGGITLVHSTPGLSQRPDHYQG
jgi:hypothetical protein